MAEEFGLLNVANMPIDACSIVVQQLTEIARAIVHRRGVILLDEPNSALTSAESDRLFRDVIRLKEQGRTIVLLVSHRLADLERYCDRVLVLREGAVVTELRGAGITTAAIAQAIVGTDFEAKPASSSRRATAVPGFDAAPALDPAGDIAAPSPEPGRRLATSTAAIRPTQRAAGEPGANVIEVRDWSDVQGNAFSDVDLTVRAGEALFITGQEDGGGRELLRSIAGLRRATGTAVALPKTAGGSACYLPGNRASSLFPNLSVRANLCVRLHPHVVGSRSGLLRMDVMSATASEWVERLEIRTSSVRAPIGSLSGGTQQKVAIGSAFARQPTILILEDPTRGVDVKTRQQIVAALRAFVARGNSILGFSPELDEVFELADTVRVAVRGSLSSAIPLNRDQSLDLLAQSVDRMNQENGNGGTGLSMHPTDTDEGQSMNPDAAKTNLAESVEHLGRQI